MGEMTEDEWKHYQQREMSWWAMANAVRAFCLSNDRQGTLTHREMVRRPQDTREKWQIILQLYLDTKLVDSLNELLEEIKEHLPLVTVVVSIKDTIMIEGNKYVEFSVQ